MISEPAPESQNRQPDPDLNSLLRALSVRHNPEGSRLRLSPQASRLLM